MFKNKLVTFFKEEESYYNPLTGEYESEQGESVERYCNVSELSNKRAFENFGERVTSALSIRLTQPLKGYKFACVDSTKYKIISELENQGRTTFIVEKVNE